MVYSTERRQLLEAVEKNDLETVKYLFTKKQVPISPAVAHIAAEKGFTEILRFVAKNAPSALESNDPYGNNILHLGVGTGGMTLSTLKFFVEKMNVSLTKLNDQRQTVARLAARNGNLNIVKYVVERKPLVISRRDLTGKTIFHMGDENKVMTLVKFLEKKYGDHIPYWHQPDFESMVVHTAIELGHWTVLKYFVEKKNCDVDAANNDQETLVFSALKYARHDMFRYLVEERNASLTKRDDDNNNILFITVNRKDLPTMKYILDERKADIDVNWQNNFGNTLIHDAITTNQTDILEYLVEQKGADVNVAAEGKTTPLHRAAARNNYEICKYLVEHGADANLEDESGFYPKSFVGNDLINTYLRQARVGRVRRGIEAPDLVDVYLDGRMNVQGSDARIGPTSSPWHATAFSSVGGSLSTFLLLAKFMLFRNAGMQAYHHPGERYLSLSRTAILQGRMDPVAVDVVHDNELRGQRSLFE